MEQQQAMVMEEQEVQGVEVNKEEGFKFQWKSATIGFIAGVLGTYTALKVAEKYHAYKLGKKLAEAQMQKEFEQAKANATNTEFKEPESK